MPSELFVNATGAAALAMNVRGLSQPSDRFLQRSIACSSALWALNSLLLGAHSAAAMCMLAVGREAAVASIGTRAGMLRAFTCASFLLATAIVAMLTWHGLATVLTAAASMLATVAMSYLGGARLRIALAAVAALWIYNGVAYEAWWQLASTLLSLATAVYGAWRTRGTW